MKIPLPALIPAVLILTGGFFLLQHQRREIAALENAVPGKTANPAGPSTLSPLFSPKAAPVKAAAASTSPSAGSASGEAKAAAFIDGLRAKVHPLVEKADREAGVRIAHTKANRVGLLLNLSQAEAASLRMALEKLSGAALTAAARQWVAENRGEDAAAKLDAAEAAGRTAKVEHEAQEAIYRLSRIVDLTPVQKDKLFASFVRKASSAPDPEPAPSELAFSFSLKDTPVIDNPSDLARSLLTPEQLALCDATRKQESKARSEALRDVMGQLMPAILSSLEAAANE
jgi:hypothetical protein